MNNNEAKILISEQGAKQTQTAFDQTGKAAGKMGESVNKAGKSGSAAAGDIGTGADKAAGKLDNLSSKAMDMVKGFAGLSAVVAMINSLNEQLAETIRLRDQALQASMTPLELGQQMAVQTGSGTQESWAKQITNLQMAAGFKGPQAAAELMTAMDVMFSDRGGIADQGISELTSAIAPDIAAMGLSGEQTSAAIKLAGTADVGADAESFKKFFAQLQTGFTKSKSTSMGEFLSGLQKGGTAYVAQGGSLTGAISNYSGALSVSANENLASTLLEQATRIAGGGYEKPRQAIESAYGVSFSDLSIDQRYQLLIDYAGRLPESQRMQFLTEAGVPAELASGFSKLATGGARKATASTAAAVGAASGSMITAQTARYKQSPVYRVNRQASSSGADKLLGAENYDTQIMLKRQAEQQYEQMVLAGEQPFAGRESTIARIYSDLLAEHGGYEKTGRQKWIEQEGFVSMIGGDKLQSSLIERSATKHYNDKAPVILNYNFDKAKTGGEGYTQEE
jgi:hypothetical protein